MSILQTAKSLLPYASGGTSVLSGIFQIGSAGDVGRAKKKLLDSQISYNKKQLQESLQKNYAAVLSKYATERNDIIVQRNNADSSIRTKLVQDTGDVDINESSFRGTAYGQLDKEFIEGMNTIRENNTNNLINLVSDTINKEMQLNIAQAQGHMQINQETEQSKMQGVGKILDGGFKIADTFITNKYSEEQKAQTEQSNQQYNPSLVSGWEYYNNRNNSGWNQYTKSNNNDPLQLKFFNFKY